MHSNKIDPIQFSDIFDIKNEYDHHYRQANIVKIQKKIFREIFKVSTQISNLDKSIAEYNSLLTTNESNSAGKNKDTLESELQQIMEMKETYMKFQMMAEETILILEELSAFRANTPLKIKNLAGEEKSTIISHEINTLLFGARLLNQDFNNNHDSNLQKFINDAKLFMQRSVEKRIAHLYENSMEIKPHFDLFPDEAKPDLSGDSWNKLTSSAEVPLNISHADAIPPSPLTETYNLVNNEGRGDGQTESIKDNEEVKEKPESHFTYDMTTYLKRLGAGSYGYIELRSIDSDIFKRTNPQNEKIKELINDIDKLKMVLKEKNIIYHKKNENTDDEKNINTVNVEDQIVIKIANREISDEETINEGVIGTILGREFLDNNTHNKTNCNPSCLVSWEGKPLILSRPAQKGVTLYLMDLKNRENISDAHTNREKLLVKMFQELMNGMKFMHSKGILHLDLAMRNLLTDENDKIVLSDFGLSRIIDAPMRNETIRLENLDQSLKNKEEVEKFNVPIKWYPEESLRTQDVSRATDFYSAQVTMIELIAAAAGLKHIMEFLPPPKEIIRLRLGEKISELEEEFGGTLSDEIFHRSLNDKYYLLELITVLERELKNISNDPRAQEAKRVLDNFKPFLTADLSTMNSPADICTEKNNLFMQVLQTHYKTDILDLPYLSAPILTQAEVLQQGIQSRAEAQKEIKPYEYMIQPAVKHSSTATIAAKLMINPAQSTGKQEGMSEDPYLGLASATQAATTQTYDPGDDLPIIQKMLSATQESDKEKDPPTPKI